MENVTNAVVERERPRMHEFGVALSLYLIYAFPRVYLGDANAYLVCRERS